MSSSSSSAPPSAINFTNHSPEELQNRCEALKDDSYINPLGHNMTFSQYLTHLKKYPFDFWTFEMSVGQYFDFDPFDDPTQASVLFVKYFIECVGNFQNYADAGGDVTELYQNSRDGSYFYSTINEFHKLGCFPQTLMSNIVSDDTTGIIESINTPEDKVEALEWFDNVEEINPYWFDQTYESFVLFMLINFPAMANHIKQQIINIQFE